MDELSKSEELQKRTLGEVKICEEAFYLDLKINDGYQAYSKELLRLALLAIAGVSTVWLRIHFDLKPWERPTNSVGCGLLLACYLLTFSAGLSLLHRFWAVDGLAYHLTALRRRIRNKPADDEHLSDEDQAEIDLASRDWRFKYCGWLLIFAGASLGAGLISFVFALQPLMQIGQ